MAQSINVVSRGDLRLHVFQSSPVIFQVASVVIEGPRELALVDGQFSADNAHSLAEYIHQIGKPLKTIFISYSDPDFYFGLAALAEAFPKARFVATPQTRWLIDTTKDEKLSIWAPQMGANAPQKIVVPEALADDHFLIDGHRVEICRPVDDESHAWLWIPSAHTILGGVYLDEGEHIWVADSPTPADRRKWLAALDAMQKQRPELTIPAHFAEPDFEAPIAFTRKYLTTLESTLAATKTATEVIAAMKRAFPNLPGEQNLEMTARVLKGETAWKTARAFPAIERKVEVNFGGEFVFELTFHDDKTMTYRSLRERTSGAAAVDTLHYTAVEVAPQVWMVYWTESDNTHVVHVEDYGGGVAYTNISSPDGLFTNLKGTLKML